MNLLMYIVKNVKMKLTEKEITEIDNLQFKLCRKELEHLRKTVILFKYVIFALVLILLLVIIIK